MPWNERFVVDDGFSLGQIHATSGARANLPLNSAFVRGVSGASVGIRLRSRVSQPINEVYVFNDATTGTRANVSMLARVYDLAGSGAQPGTVLRATSNAATLPAADDRWIRFVFPTPYTPAVGEWVFITVENTAAAPATDFPGIMTASQMNSFKAGNQAFCFTTTNGYSTNGTSQGETPFVVLQGTDEVVGMPFTITGGVASFVGKRGILVSGDVKKFRFRYMRNPIGGNPWTNVQVYDLATPPSGTPLLDYLVPAGMDRVSGVTELTSLDFSTLPGSGPFVVCLFYPATAASHGGMLLIEDYASFPSIFDRFTQDNFLVPPYVFESAGNWVVDRSRTGGMFIQPYDTVSASGGSGLILPIGFDGGYSG